MAMMTWTVQTCSVGGVRAYEISQHHKWTTLSKRFQEAEARAFCGTALQTLQGSTNAGEGNWTAEPSEKYPGQIAMTRNNPRTVGGRPIVLLFPPEDLLAVTSQLADLLPPKRPNQ